MKNVWARIIAVIAWVILGLGLLTAVLFLVNFMLVAADTHVTVASGIPFLALTFLGIFAGSFLVFAFVRGFAEVIELLDRVNRR